MRACARSSASKTSISHFDSARAISPELIARPSFRRSTRSKRLEQSLSAASPRVRTSAMISRATASTSSETSRFIARSCEKRSPKSGIARSSRSGMSFKLFRFADRAIDSHAFVRRILGGMIGLASTRPARTDVTHLRLEAFYSEAHAGAAGEREHHFARRRFRRLEDDRQKVQHLFRLPRPKARRAHVAHPLEMHAGLQALAAPLVCRQPIEARCGQSKALTALQERHVVGANDRVLEVRRDDGEVLLVEDEELQHPGVGFCRGGRGGHGSALIPRAWMPAIPRPNARPSRNPALPAEGLDHPADASRPTPAPQPDSLCPSRSKPRSRW